MEKRGFAVRSADTVRDGLAAGPLAEDVDLIISQSARCRAILAKLRNLGDDGGDPFAAMPLGELLAEVAKPHEGQGGEIVIAAAGSGPDPVFRRNVGLIYGLGNLIENACQFALAQVRVEASWDDLTIAVAITDDGPGFPPELMARLGDPYLTSRLRPVAGARGGDTTGLGLGIFIAKTLLQRSGATLSFQNAGPDGGALVRIGWRRQEAAAAGLLL
jgi:two-component system sensor histidine kinase RegB